MNTRTHLIGAALLLITLAGLYGCEENPYNQYYATERAGDKAWGKGNYKEALEHYEQSLQELESIPNADYILISRRANYARKLLDYAAHVDHTKFEIARYEYEKILKRKIPVIEGMVTEEEIKLIIEYLKELNE